jgi:hypothetical protein
MKSKETKMSVQKNKIRSNHQRGLYSQTRSVSISPKSLDEKTRSVEATAATEAPVMMPDYERGMMVPEVLLMSGLRIPTDKMLPLQDSHRTSSVFHTLGSFSDLHVAGDKYDGRASFSEDDDGNKAFIKVKGGHVKSFSVGYEVYKSVFVPENETQVIAGKSFIGPVRVVTDWEAYEISLTAFPADKGAQARSEPQSQTPVNPSAKRADTKTGGSFFMNKWLRFILIQRGLAEGSTDEQAKTFFDALPIDQQQLAKRDADIAEKAIATGGKDPEAETRAREEGQKLEVERQSQIRSMCQVPGCEDLADELCKDPATTPDMASRKIIERMKQTRAPVGTRVALVADEREKFHRAAFHGIELRSGLIVENPAPGAMEIRGMSLIRLAEECLIRAGLPHRFSDPSELMTRAMGTTDFVGILSNSANKVMQAAYNEADETWDIWVEIGEGRDFKSLSRPQLSESADLSLVKPNGEYNEVAFSEMAPDFTIKTYGAEAAFTRQMGIDDNLNAFMRIPQQFGRAAQRKIGDLVYNILTSNQAINSTGTSLALFHASHNNLMTPALNFGFEGISEMRRMMRVQKGLKDKTLSQKLKYCLVPAALETVAEMFFASTYIPQTGAGPIDNPFKGKVRPVVESRLDANSIKAYYGVSDYRDGAGTVEVAFLNGVKNPTIVQFEGNNPDVRKVLCRIDVGVGLKDHRGLNKSAGA